jgi:hypothetical protein
MMEGNSNSDRGEILLVALLLAFGSACLENLTLRGMGQ